MHGVCTACRGNRHSWFVALTNCSKHEAAYALQKERRKKKDGVLKQHKDSEERDQTGIFTAVADCSEDNMDRQAFTGV